jgi:hypothetical protein
MIRNLIFASFLLTIILFNKEVLAGHSNTSKPSEHAPIGVMGDHTHKQNEWMFSYRYMFMDMHGSKNGTDNISPLTIATTIPNRFFGTAGQPSTLRVVPTSMSMEMHMLGLMYAPSDFITLMLMGMWQEKEMDHITFAGGAGNNVLGSFTTRSSGWGDTKLSGLINIFQKANHNAHLTIGFSAPTGAIDKTATVLAPNNTTPRLRMPYSMQLGTGTYDFHPALTYNGRNSKWSWGAQYSSEFRLENENDESYAWGDKHNASIWGAYDWKPWVSSSLRVNAEYQSKIDGIDPNILAPVQTADPDNYGGREVSALFGINLIATKGHLKGNRLAIEASIPFYKDLNGPQLEKEWSLMIGFQKSF